MPVRTSGACEGSRRRLRSRPISLGFTRRAWLGRLRAFRLPRCSCSWCGCSAQVLQEPRHAPLEAGTALHRRSRRAGIVLLRVPLPPPDLPICSFAHLLICPVCQFASCSLLLLPAPCSLLTDCGTARARSFLSTGEVTGNGSERIPVSAGHGHRCRAKSGCQQRWFL